MSAVRTNSADGNQRSGCKERINTANQRDNQQDNEGESHGLSLNRSTRGPPMVGRHTVE